MKMVRFHPDAETEMIDAAVYYESKQRDLGKRFLVAVQEAVNKIQIAPFLYPTIHVDVRRCLTKTFPFGILYRIIHDQVLIVAVMHLRRDPDCWKNR